LNPDGFLEITNLEIEELDITLFLYCGLEKKVVLTSLEVVLFNE